jgi:hypothetical protein
VRLKIAVFFDFSKYDKRKRVYVDIETDEYNNLTDEIHKVLETKIDIYASKCSLWGLNALKPGETFESVLEALWEYQLSLIPNKYGVGVFKFIYNENREAIACFYDPETRIITITSWEGEA